MKKNRVLIVVNSLAYGGVENLLNSTQKYIDRDRFELFYLCIQRNASKADAYVEEIEQNGGKVTFLPCSAADVRSYRRDTIKMVQQVITSNKIDFLHIHHNGSFLVALAATLLKRPIIIHSHSTKFYWPEGMLRKIFYAPINLTNMITARWIAKYRIAVGEKAGKFLYGAREFYYLSNGIDVEVFEYSHENRIRLRKELKISKTDDVILHVGRMAHPKNQIFVVDVFNQLIKLHQNVKLVLVGSGPDLSRVKRRVSELGLNQSVVFLGSRRDVYALYSAADVLLLPSFFEGMPVTLIEAQVNGLRCLVSHTVDQGVKLTDAIEFYSLQKTARQWSERIGSIDRARLDTRGIFRESEYNVKLSVKKLELIYRAVSQGE